MIWIAIAIPILCLVAKLVYDYRLWLRHKNVNHKKEWLIVALACVPSILIFTMESTLTWYFAAPVAGIMDAFFIWLFFDGIYNKLRGYGWWFTGSDDQDDATTDNILQRLKLWQHILIKTLPLAGSILFLISS